MIRVFFLRIRADRARARYKAYMALPASEWNVDVATAYRLARDRLAMRLALASFPAR
jgi:hypothetical protein